MSSKENYKQTNPLSKFEILFGALFLVLTFVILINSKLFAVKTVKVNGNREVSAEDIILNARLNSYRNIFQIESHKIKTSILRDLRIASVQIRRKLPGTIIITVQERVPICLLAYLDNLLIIGDDGMVMGIQDEAEPVELPVVTGAKLKNIKFGEKVTFSSFQTALEVLKYCDNYLHQVISKIDLAKSRLYLDLPDYRHPVEVELGAAEQLEEKMANLRAILLSPDFNSELKQIDLRVPDLPTIITSGHEGQ